MKYIISIKSTKYHLIYIYMLFIKKMIELHKGYVIQIDLPNKKKRITLLKSPNVNKKAKDTYEKKIFSMKLYLFLANGTYKNLIKYLIKYKPIETYVKLFFFNKT